jgi:hypothetical protein
MKTEEAIEFLKGYIYRATYYDNEMEIIKLLQRGEKYRIMYRDTLTNMKISQEAVEQKYSPKDKVIK